MPSSIADDVASVPWYHTIELPDGVVTPGYFDLRSIRPQVPIPDLTGKRCLDVGSATGLWAFEMEKAGAAEVVSFDLDDKSEEDRRANQTGPDVPVGIAAQGFEIVKRHLGSSVQRVDGSIYDLSPDLVGEFDFVFIGSLLLHLRDPIGGLTAVRSVCTGELLSLDLVSPWLTFMHPWQPTYGMWATQYQQWFLPNRAGRRQMLELAGFSVIDRSRVLHQRMGIGFEDYRVPMRRARSPKTLILLAYNRYRGVPTDWLLAR